MLPVIRNTFYAALFACLCLITAYGCGCRAKDPVESFVAETRRLDWYEPARQAIREHLEDWHKQKGRAVKSSAELALYVGHPLRFEVKRGGSIVPYSRDWSTVRIKPVGTYAKDPRYYDYEVDFGELSGVLGVRLID